MMMLAFVLAATFQMPPQKSNAVIGVAAVEFTSGERIGIRNTERFPMASVFKVPLAIEVLHQIDEGKLRGDRVITIKPRDFAPGYSPLRDAANGKPIKQTISELLDLSVRVSDNTAADVLLQLVGKDAVNRRLAASGGITGVRVDRNEKELAAGARDVKQFTADPRDTATPDGMLALLLAIEQNRVELSEKSRNKLLRWMTITKTGANRVRAGLPSDAVFVHKTGTGPGVMNDVGIIDDHMILAIFTKGATSPDADVESDIAAVARAVYAALPMHGR